MLADQAIRAGDIDIAVAGGMESMSNCPYLLPRVREGLRMGNGELLDAMIADGLWCAFEQCHMGNAGEVVAEHYHVGREAQDAYAALSHQKAAPRRPPRAASPTRSCRSRSRRRRDAPLVVDRDESIRADTTVESLGQADAGVQEGRHGDRRQRARRERRRVGARRDGRRARDAASASRRSPASSARRRAASRRSSC